MRKMRKIWLMNYVEELIDLFGGLSSFSRRLGHKHPTTVQGWKDRGSIPTKYWGEILQLANTDGIDLGPEFFVSRTIQTAA